MMIPILNRVAHNHRFLYPFVFHFESLATRPNTILLSTTSNLLVTTLQLILFKSARKPVRLPTLS